VKVSVITPTWQRHDLLLDRCIPSVQAQTWPDVEHVVVSDGPDPTLRDRLTGVDVVYVELAEHPDDDCNYGAYSRNHGLTIAAGDLVAYLDDDNSFRPQHVQRLAEALIAHPDRDFAYSRMYRHGLDDEIGGEPPEHGRVDSSILMHRAGAHEKFGCWPTPSPYAVDWEFVKTWVLAGATWVFVNEVTVDYYHREHD
jgi:glycosyltransferase involved in cell wall biosynthesis